MISLSQQREINSVKTTTMPEIDGLIESVWDQSEWHTEFTQTEPYPEEPSTEKTAFKILYDEENIYFLVYAYANPSTISTSALPTYIET